MAGGRGPNGRGAPWPGRTENSARPPAPLHNLCKLWGSAPPPFKGAAAPPPGLGATRGP